MNIVYVVPERRRQGVTKALLAAFGERAREQGLEHLTLDVATPQRGRPRGLAAARLHRVGAAADACRSSGSSSTRARGESYASLHVQTDDRRRRPGAGRQVPAAARRLGRPRSRARATAGSRVYAELVDRDRKARERLASELSNATAAVVCAISVDDGVVVRYVLYERGSVVDEYQSLPEHFGPLPPGDVVALGANPTVVSRLTGAEPAARCGPSRARPPRPTSCRPRTSSCSSSPR